MPECQICGREIKASKGLIAHHGYSRPYQQNFQTSSCFGARYQPYEIAHDAIDKYLSMLAQWIVDATTQFDAWKASPPATISYQRRNGWKQAVGEPLTLIRPDAFNSTECANRGSHRPSTYESIYSTRYHEMERSIAGLIADQKELTRRRAAWKGEV